MVIGGSRARAWALVWCTMWYEDAIRERKALILLAFPSCHSLLGEKVLHV